jgi:hypothetical protein
MKNKYVDDFDYTKVIDIVGLDDDEITDVKDTLSLLVDWKDLGNANLRKIRGFLTPIDYRVIAFIIFEATGMFAKKIQDKTHPWNELYRVIVFNINLHYPFIDPVIACKKIGVSAHDKEQSLLCSAAVMLVFVRSAFDDEDYDYDKLREVSIRELIQRIENKLYSRKNDYLLMSALWFLSANRYDVDEC